MVVILVRRSISIAAVGGQVTPVCREYLHALRYVMDLRMVLSTAGTERKLEEDFWAPGENEMPESN